MVFACECNYNNIEMDEIVESRDGEIIFYKHIFIFWGNV